MPCGHWKGDFGRHQRSLPSLGSLIQLGILVSREPRREIPESCPGELDSQI